MDKPFERILVVMFENQYRHYIMQDPYMKKLAAAGANMRNFFGCFHPSQTNYLASLAGEVCAVTNDTPPAEPLLQKTLVDVMEDAGVSWKAYMEAYPGEDWNPAWRQPQYADSEQPITQFPDAGPDLARYYRKHNAFASFHSIQSDPARWQCIVDDHQFWRDLNSAELPQYAWFTPDIWNDGHYLYHTHEESKPRTRMISQISNWLEYVFMGSIASNHVQGGAASGVEQLGLGLDLDLLLENPQQAWSNSRVPPGTLIVITFDEADFNAVGYDTSYDGPNQIYTVLLGDMIESGTEVDAALNHYSLMRTVQRNFGLSSLGKNDAGSNWLRFLWQQSFKWAAPVESTLTAGDLLGLACEGDSAHLVTGDRGCELRYSSLEGAHWSAAQGLGLTADGDVALAVINGELFLALVTAGTVSLVRRSADGHWSQPRSLGHACGGALALARYVDLADGQAKLMLCWSDPNGFIRYCNYSEGQWSEEGEVGQLTDGAMTLAQLGTSLYLVYKQRNTREMRITSFNLAPFNAFKGYGFADGAAPAPRAPANDTTLHRWSVADMPVGHFSGKLDAVHSDYLTIGRPTMASIDGEMHLVHRGAYEDTPGAATCVFGLNGVFTAGNPLSNGHGTLRQAGWTPEKDLAGTGLDPDSPVALASNGASFLLVWREAGGSELCYRVGQFTTDRQTSIE